MTRKQFIACTTFMCIGVVGHASTLTNLSEPKPCVYDGSHDVFKRRTLKIGKRKFKLVLGRCVPDADAVAILKAYDNNQIVDRRVTQSEFRMDDPTDSVPRRLSAGKIFEIYWADTWRSLPEEGFAKSQYVVGLDAPENMSSLDFVSLESGIVTLWAHEYAMI